MNDTSNTGSNEVQVGVHLDGSPATVDLGGAPHDDQLREIRRGIEARVRQTRREKSVFPSDLPLVMVVVDEATQIAADPEVTDRLQNILRLGRDARIYPVLPDEPADPILAPGGDDQPNA